MRTPLPPEPQQKKRPPGRFFVFSDAVCTTDGASSKKKTAGLEGGVSPTVCQIPALGNEGHYVDIGMSAGFFNVDQIA